MNFLQYIFPIKTIYKDTEYNKNIFVQQFMCSSTLYVDGLIQSGDIMTSIWKTGLKKLLPPSFRPQSVLLLGLAGGSNVHLINHYYPDANITAVEIDSGMIAIGEKHFGLKRVNHLRVIIADALDYSKKLKSNDFFDLILVDCFEGKYIPKKLENLDFITSLRSHSRYTLINRLTWFEHKQTTLSFMRSLASKFFYIKTHTLSNVVISLV